MPSDLSLWLYIDNWLIIIVPLHAEGAVGVRYNVYSEIFTSWSEGCFLAPSGPETCSDCCLRLFTKWQLRVPSTGWFTHGSFIWWCHCATGRLQCSHWQQGNLEWRDWEELPARGVVFCWWTHVQIKQFIQNWHHVRTRGWCTWHQDTLGSRSMIDFGIVASDL